MTRFLPRFLSRHSLGQRLLWMGPAVLMVLAVLLMVGAPPAQAQEKMSEQEKQMLAQLQEMNQADGYLEAHRNVKQPLELLGGPLSFTIRQSSGGVFVSLPDHRTLDPDVFGTPEQPLAFTGTPGMTGVPVPLRGVSDGQFTQFERMSPFGDKNTTMANGNLMLQATDRTATDAATTDDEVTLKASWEDSDGNTYAIRCCEMLVSAGPEFPTFGGVVTNHMLHGFTGIGTPLMPT